MKETIKKRKRKKGFSRVLSVFLAMVLCLSTVLGMPGLGIQVRAANDADTVRFDITGPAFLKVGQAGLSKEAFTLKSTIRSGTEYTDQIYSLTGNVTKATITGDEVRYDAKIFIDMNYTLADTKVYYNGCYVQTLEKNGYQGNGLTITLSFNCKVDITSYDETTVLQTVYVPQGCNVPVPDTSVNPSLEGYTFCGWVTSDGVKYDFQSQVDTATLALYPLMLSNSATYSWNEDNTQVTGYSNNLKESLGVFSETVEIDPVTYETVTPSTCTTPGVGRYTSNAFVTPVFTPQTVDFELPLSPSTHKTVKRNRLDPTDDTNGYYTHWECTECHKRFVDSNGQVEYEDVYIPMLKCFTYADGVMTLRGYLDKSKISNFAYKSEVKTIVASEGTSLPSDSSGLFMNFTNCTSIDLSNADTSTVKNMSSMFAECSNLETLNVSSFNTQKVTNMAGMFYGCKKLKSLDLSNFVTPTLTSVESMFNGCSELMALDIRKLNTNESTTNFSQMFGSCHRLCELTLGPGIAKITYYACLPKTSSGWARGDVNGDNISGHDNLAVLNNSGTNTYYKKVFLSGTLSITKEDDYPITTPEPGMVLKAVVQNEVCDEQYLSYQWKRGDTAISNATSSTYTVTKSDVGKIISCVVTDQSGYYKGELTATTGTEVIQGSEVSFKNGVLTIGGVVDLSDIYYFDKKSSVTKIVASEGTILPQDSSSLFSGYGNCTSIDLSNADTSLVTNMSSMFADCYSLESLDISNFNTEKVTDMSQMFSSCSKLTSLNLSNFVTLTLADTMDMFYNCSSLVSLDIRNLKIDANTSINNMFGACYQLRELTLGAGITNIPANVGLSQGNQGWARGSKTGNRISGDQYFAEFSNSGTNTYYLRSVLAGTIDLRNEYNNHNFIPMTGKKLEVVVSLNYGSDSDLSYQWKRGNTNISGATSSTYTPTKADIGSKITCVVKDKTGVYAGELKVTTKSAVILGSEISFKNGVLTIGGNVTADDIHNAASKENVKKIVASEGTVLPESCYSLFSDYVNCTEIDLSKADTSKVTNMSYMFANCYNLESVNVSSFNTNKVTDMGDMFRQCKKLTSLDLSSFVTPTLTSTERMFYDCDKLTVLDIRNLKIDTNTDVYNMFYNSSQLKELTLGTGINNISDDAALMNGYQGWARGSETGNQISGYQYYAVFSNSGTNTYYKRFILAGITRILDENGYENFVPMTGKKLEVSVTYENISCVPSELSYQWKRGNTNISKATSSTYTLTKADVGYKISCVVKDKNGVYAGELKGTTESVVVQGPEVTFKDGVLTIGGNVTADDIHNAAPKENVKKIVASEGTILPEYCGALFASYENCTVIDLSKADTSKVTSMCQMFYLCKNLTTLKTDNFNTSKVTDMSFMFCGCENLTSLDLSKFNTAQVTDMRAMFTSCGKLTSLNLNSFNTSKVTNMSEMFSECSSLTKLDLSKFDTENVTDMSHMFGWCRNLKSLNISSFNTSNVTTMQRMFDSCDKLTSLNVSNFDTQSVTSMNRMFAYCRLLPSLDLSNFNMNNVTDRDGMFEDSTALKTLKLGAGFKEIKYEDHLANGSGGWARGSSTGKKISGDDLRAEFTNSGKNTYYKLEDPFRADAILVFADEIVNEVVDPVETPVCGKELVAATQYIGVDYDTISYQWRRGNTDITGATSARYTPGAADVGYKISCVLKDKTGALKGEEVVASKYATVKADGPAKPTGLKATAPSVQGGADGKITGVTKAMEYATSKDFKNAVKCTSTSITGLKAGTYYVRIAATGTTKAGAYATVTVKDGAAAHTHGGTNATYHKAVAATCEKAGNSAYYECNCGKYFSDKACTKEISKNSWVIAKLGHNFAKATYKWSSDYKTVTGTRVCQNDSSHIETETVTSTYEVVKAATETEVGTGRYTAVFTKEGFSKQVKDVEIPKGKHKHGGKNATYHKAVAATCTKAGNSAYWECSCGKYFSDEACTKAISKDSWVIAKKGHNYGAATYEWSADNKKVTALKVCQNDASHTIKEEVTTTYKEVKAATETKDGVGRFTATFKNADFTTQVRDVTIVKTSHKHGGENATYHKAVAATCEKAGNSAYYSCNCGLFFSDKACTKAINENSWVIKAKGHNYGDATYTWSSDNKKVTGTRVCQNDAKHTDTEEVTTTYVVIEDATEKATGIGRYTATFTKEGFTTQIKDVEIPKKEVVSKGDVTKAFTDVPAGQWYVAAIQFVYDNSIMNGTSDTTFAPLMVLTRGQFVTVLYNMEGRPEAKYDASIFKDVKEKDFFALPVIWAAANDITSGTGNGQFSPNAKITREQLAVMLYKYSIIKNYKTEFDKAALDNFPDKKSVSSWATEAMQWAVSNKVIGGKTGKNGNILDPSGQATRAECAQMIKNLTDNVVAK